MKLARSPDAVQASRLLNELAGKPAVVSPRKVDKPLILYGAGNLGKMASAYLDTIDVPFLHVLDAKPALYRDDPFWQDVGVLGVHDFSASAKQDFLLAVCVATSPFSEIHADLERQGWTDIVPFYDIAEAYRDVHPLGNGWFAGPLDDTDISNTASVLTRWADDMSRAHHLQFIAWHALREDWLFDDAPVNGQDRFFIPEVRAALSADEVFLDLGAHHGEVVSRYMQLSGYREVWAVEPDSASFRVLRSRLKKESEDGRIRLLSCAVGEQEGRQAFCEGLGYASQLSALGSGEIDVRTIDRLGIASTFIKLHLEGGELAALKGGLETLRRHRPLIAATCYHNRQGMWALPKWLMNSLEDYVFIFRLHSWCGTGAVVYGIPKERSCIEQFTTNAKPVIQ